MMAAKPPGKNALKEIPVEDRIRLSEQAVTLDGKPAKVSGVYNQFALVWCKSTPGKGVQFSWAAVRSVIKTRGGRFKS